MSLWTTLKAAIVGVGVGEASAEVFGPILTPAGQDAWAKNPYKALAVGTVAELVAQGLTGEGTAATEAALTGHNPQRLHALTQALLKSPSIGQGLVLLRRGAIDRADFLHVLRKQMMEPAWDEQILSLQEERLDPADLARGIHKGLIPDPGLLAVPSPHGTGKVPAYPVYPIDALKEAEASGIDRQRLGVMVGLQGNPMGPHEAAQAYFRGVLARVDYDRAIAEGNTRNEWGDAIMAQTRQIPTARDFLENALRGYHTLAEAIEGAARHGMSAEDATLIYQNQGRPMNVATLNKALARGGVFKPEPGEITDPFQAAIVEGNLKPAYYDLAKAMRYTIPSYFVIKAVLASGGITVEEAADYFKQSGWPPDLAEKAAKALSSGGSGGKQLTTAQLRSAVASGQLTHDAALKKLEARGYSAEDAAIILNNPTRTAPGG